MLHVVWDGPKWKMYLYLETYGLKYYNSKLTQFNKLVYPFEHQLVLAITFLLQFWFLQ